MPKFINATIEEYLGSLSKKKSTPGGGSAAALSAALGVALNLMVANYSLRPGTESKDQETILETLASQEESLDVLKRLIDEDCRVFEALMNALSDGKEAQEEYMNASAVPMEVCRECHNGVKAILDIIEYLNKNLMSDVKCAVQIFSGAFYSAKFNVEINLKKITDVLFVEKTESELRDMAAGLETLKEKLK